MTKKIKLFPLPSLQNFVVLVNRPFGGWGKHNLFTAYLDFYMKRRQTQRIYKQERNTFQNIFHIGPFFVPQRNFHWFPFQCQKKTYYTLPHFVQRCRWGVSTKTIPIPSFFKISSVDIGWKYDLINSYSILIRSIQPASSFTGLVCPNFGQFCNNCE